MNKGTKAFSLAMSVILIAGVLASCSTSEYTYPDASWKDNVIVNIGGKEYTYDEIYKLFDGEQASAQAYYNTAKNVLAQIVTPVNSAITSYVNGQIDDQEQTWKDNAETNNTSYKEEQEATFEEENVDNMDEYRAKLIAQRQNEVNSNSYYIDTLSDDADGGYYYISKADAQEFVEKSAPYHVSHVLVQLDAESTASGSGIWDGHISSTDAQQIFTVVSALSSTTTFGNVARDYSDDSSSDSYGDLGGSSGAALTKTTSYVNEFKLGIYAYDAFINPETKDDEELKVSLQVPGATSGEGHDSPVATDIASTEIGQGKAYGIPVSVAFRLGYVANQENADNGQSVSYTSETQYPRNILFNNYFNNHSVSFIYNDQDEYAANFLKDVNAVYGKSYSQISEMRAEAASDPALMSRINEYDYVMAQFGRISDTKFKTVNNVSDNLVAYTYTDSSSTTAEISALSGSKKILVDEYGDPIIVTRAGSGSTSDGSESSGYQGIHFIVVKENPFVDKENSYKYWRVNVPSNDSDATEADSFDYNTHPSYVNYVRADHDSNTTYNTRIENVRTSVKGSDANYDFKLFEKNLASYQANHGGTSFYDALGDNKDEIQSLIENYIQFTRESSETSNIKSLNDSWVTYIQQLNLFEDYAPKRVVPTVCVSYFQSGSYGQNGEMEALCHVER